MENILRIITYHRVAELKSCLALNPRMISATPDAFAKHIQFLAANYRTVRVEDVLEAVAAQRALPQKAVLLTFDDAYADFYRTAWPILQRFGLPATVFVPTAYPDRPERAFWWDRLYRAFANAADHTLALPETPLCELPLHKPVLRRQSLKRLQNFIKTLEHEPAMALVDEVCERLRAPKVVRKSVMGWDELRQLTRAGVALGAHTDTHPVMTRLPAAAIETEIRTSLAKLQQETGQALPVFCYPSGGHSTEVVTILRRLGIKLGFTCRDGHNDLHSVDPLKLRRTDITRRTTPALFRLRLARWMTYVDGWRHREERQIVAER